MTDTPVSPYQAQWDPEVVLTNMAARVANLVLENAKLQSALTTTGARVQELEAAERARSNGNAKAGHEPVPAAMS